MAKWRIDFKGFAYVEADTVEDAREVFENECESYKEQEEDDPIQVDEFGIEI